MAFTLASGWSYAGRPQEHNRWRRFRKSSWSCANVPLFGKHDAGGVERERVVRNTAARGADVGGSGGADLFCFPREEGVLTAATRRFIGHFSAALQTVTKYLFAPVSCIWCALNRTIVSIRLEHPHSK